VSELGRPTDLMSGGDGGMASRIAVLRWSLRMFRREWRQQIFICVLVAVAVAVTILGAGVISGAEVPQNAGFGTANQQAQLQGIDPHLAAELTALRAHFGTVGVIQSVPVNTGAAQGATLEAFDPNGPFVHPLVQLVSGRFATNGNEVDLSPVLAQLYRVHVGGTWVAVGKRWQVVGEVRAPTNLNQPFALAAPGAIPHPQSVTALFDAAVDQLATFSPPKAFYSTLVTSIAGLPAPGFNVGEFLVLIAGTFGMLFIGLIAVAGFTVMARRRTRAIGMLGALGAPEKRVRAALLLNGLAVGVVSMVVGGVVGLGAWWLYAPHQQGSVGHVVDPAGIAWWLVVVAMVLAPVTTTLAARRPALVISRLPVVTALSGRPTEPKISKRNAAIGASLLGGGVLVVFAGNAGGPGGGGGHRALPVLIGIVLSAIGLFLVAQWAVAQLGRLAGHVPVAARVALRDLARYRSRSGAALGAICLALLMTGVVVIAATARYSDPFDWVGPNLTSNTVLVYSAGGGPGGGPGPVQCNRDQGCKGLGGVPSQMTTAQLTALAHRIAAAIGATNTVALDQTDALINRTTSGRGFDGPVYVATPALLKQYGISPSSISPTAMLLTSRPGLPGDSPQLAIQYGQSVTNPNFDNGNYGPCPPGYCVPAPQIEEVSQLPTGTSAPNTVLTMYAVHRLDLTLSVTAYNLTTSDALTAQQKQIARSLATEAGTTIETANSFATLNVVLAWSIGAGLLLALGVLAMTVGLIRAETASELRVLTATGASRRTRRALTSVTASILGIVGAALGIVTAYLLVGAFLTSSNQDSISEMFNSIPARPLAVMLFGLPLLAGIGGWLFAGREPRVLSRQPIE
jgi:putative ABC transport system permease protein